MGGIPVDRSQRNNLVNDLVRRYQRNEIHHLGISIEGTRGYTDKWHSGAYHTAVNASLPLLLGYIDFKKKEVGIGAEIEYTGNFEQDLVKVEAFYKDKTPKYPEKFNLTTK